MTEAFDFGMTDLEERLRGPTGREVAEAALARLDARLNELETQLSTGVPAETLTQLNVVLNSVAAAKEIMVAIIQSMPSAALREN
jgi:hypothetical protein